MWVLHLFQTLVLLAILIMVILLWCRSPKTESFANCVGMQYNGLQALQHPHAPICTRGFHARYPEGGCVEYNPDDAAIAYAKGRVTPPGV